MQNTRFSQTVPAKNEQKNWQPQPHEGKNIKGLQYKARQIENAANNQIRSSAKKSKIKNMFC